MDTFRRLIFLLMLGSSAHAQETPATEPPPADPPASPGAPRILGDLPDGTPPPPSPPQPRLVIGAEDIVSSRTQDLGDHTITFQKVRPIALPPLPAPPVSVEGQAAAEGQTVSRMAVEETSKIIFLGASAYEFSQQPDQPRSFVRYWPGGTRSEPVSFWSNASFLFLSGFGSFADSSGTEHSLIMSISREKRANREEIQSGPDLPAMPAFPDESKASFVIVGGNPTPEELAPIHALMELYNHHKENLRRAYLGRVAAEEERARELRDNPPRKKNIVLSYWRMDAAGQEGQTPKPAVIR